MAAARSRRTRARRIRGITGLLRHALVLTAACLLGAAPAAAERLPSPFEREPTFQQFKQRAVDIEVRLVQPPDKGLALEPVVVFAVGRERGFPRAVARLSVGEEERVFLEPDARALEFQTATIVRRLVLPRRPFLSVLVEVQARADGVPPAEPGAPPRGVIVKLEAKIVSDQ